MFTLYFNRELIAVSTVFSEIADIFVVECLGIDKSNPAYQLCYLLFDRYCLDLGKNFPFYKDYSALAPAEDVLFEVYYDGKRQ